MMKISWAVALAALTIPSGKAAEFAVAPQKTAPSVPAVSFQTGPNVAPSNEAIPGVGGIELGALPAIQVRETPAAPSAIAPAASAAPQAISAVAAPAAPVAGPRGAAVTAAIQPIADASNPEVAPAVGLRFDGDVQRRALAGASAVTESVAPASRLSGLKRFVSAAARKAAVPLTALAVPATLAAQPANAAAAQNPQNAWAVVAAVLLLGLAVIKRAALGLTWKDFKSRVGSLFGGLAIGAGTGGLIGFFAAMIQDMNSSTFSDSMTPFFVLAAQAAAAAGGLGAFFGYYKEARWVRAFGRFVAGALGGAIVGLAGAITFAIALFMSTPALTDPSFMLPIIGWAAAPAAALLGLSNVFRKSRLLNAASMMTASSALIAMVGGFIGLVVGAFWDMIAGGDIGVHAVLPTLIAGGVSAAIGLIVGFKYRKESWQEMLAAIGAGMNSSGMVTGMLTAEAAEIATGQPINPAAIALGGALGAASSNTTGAVVGGLEAEIIADHAPKP